MKPKKDRRLKYDRPMTRHQVLLDEGTLKAIKALGAGGLSAGIREAVRQAKLLELASKP